LTEKASDPFGIAPSVGGQSAGSVPFGSGSTLCTNAGPGDGNTFGGAGIHCFDNINDDVEGNSNSHITSSTPYNGKNFVGIRFPTPQLVRGIRISRDAVYSGNSDRCAEEIKVYITRPATVPFPTFTTDSSFWQCVGIIPPRPNPGYFWYEFPTVNDASSIILELPISQAIDELKVYADVSMFQPTRQYLCCVHLDTTMQGHTPKDI
jgi:hypothetical protein